MEKPGDFKVTLRAQPSAVPAMNRIRSLLKYALRVCRLRFIEVVEVSGPDAADGSANGQPQSEGGGEQ